MAIRDRPGLLVELVTQLTGRSIDGAIEVVDATTRFARSIEVRPDLLLRTQHEGWILVELQNRIDEKKLVGWPLAVSLLRFRERAMGDVVVLTASRRVASWAMSAFHQQGHLGTRFDLAPLVIHLGGDRIGALLDAAHPELALFAAWAMHDRRGPEARRVVERAIELTERLPEPLREAQERAILALLSEQLLAYLRRLAMDVDKIPETRASRRLRLFLESRARAEGLAEGKAEGKAEGIAEGKAEGIAEGKAEGMQAALLAFFAARGLRPTAKEAARIRACLDAAKLGRWIAAAATATSVGAALRVPSKPARTRKPGPRAARR